MPIEVLIADDHAVLRAGLRMLISAQRDMSVIGEAANALDAISQVEQLSPDVVVLDLAMPGGGFAALKEIRERFPHVKVLILTMYDDPAHLQESLNAGAAGFLVKRAADTEVIDAIRTVYRGKTYLDLTLTKRMQQGAAIEPLKYTAPPTVLSQRERQVLEFVAFGHTNQQIAETLNVSIKSVETYRGRIMQKLELRSRVDLVRYALEYGMLKSDNSAEGSSP